MTRNQSYSIEFQCPQCGAPLDLGEEESFFSCGFCHVRLYFFRGEHSRFYVPANDCPGESLFYAPYWRFKGMELKFTCPKASGNLVNTTMQCSAVETLPPTLGYRDIGQRLRILEPDTPGTFLPTAFDRGSFLKRMKYGIEESRCRTDGLAGGAGGYAAMSQAAWSVLSGRSSGAGMNEPSSMTDLTASFRRRDEQRRRSVVATPVSVYVGEVISLVYIPYFVRDGYVHDGVSHYRLGEFHGSHDALRESDAGRWKPDFVAALCPWCGWDLQGTSDSLILLCPHCGSVSEVGPGGWRRVPCTVLGCRADIHIPFWRFSVTFRDLELDTVAAFVREARIARAVTASMAEAPFHFWIPAFKAAPTQFLRYGRLLSVNQPRFDERDTVGVDEAYPVTLSRDEARESLPVVFGSLFSRRKDLTSKFGEDDFTTRSAELAFLPFVKQGYEYVMPDNSMSIHRNVLKWGRRI